MYTYACLLFFLFSYFFSLSPIRARHATCNINLMKELAHCNATKQKRHAFWSHAAAIYDKTRKEQKRRQHMWTNSCAKWCRMNRSRGKDIPHATKKRSQSFDSAVCEEERRVSKRHREEEIVNLHTNHLCGGRKVSKCQHQSNIKILTY